MLVFQLILPAFQIVLYCLAIGRDPTGLNMAVLNLDNGTSFEVRPRAAPSQPIS